MKIVALFIALFVAVLSFGTNVAAQCSTVAECSGQQAEAAAQLREFRRATAAVVATDQAIARVATAQAVAERATITALSVTATWVSRPTQTPQPTSTQLPTAVFAPVATAQPASTAQVQTVSAQPPVAQSSKSPLERSAPFIVFAIIVIIATPFAYRWLRRIGF